MLRFIKSFFNRNNVIISTPSSIDEYLEMIHVTTDNKNLYETALTHGSFVSKQVESNERLEFVGDAILGAIIADVLYQRFQNKNEGKLSKMRSKLVSRQALNELGTLLNIPDYLKHRIGKSDFKKSNNYIGNALEALIGAIYLDKGYDFTYQFVLDRIINPFTDLDELDAEIKDFKSHVIIWAQKNKRRFSFEVERLVTEDENERFLAKLFIDEEEIASGAGRNKKTAQQIASQKAIEILSIVD